MRNDVNVYFLPLTVHGAVAKNEDGSYSIFINENDSYYTQRETYVHELMHIEGNDFEKHDVEEIERLNNERSTIAIGQLESESL